MKSTAWKVCLACRPQPRTLTVPAKLRTRLVLLLAAIAVCFGPLLAATVDARWIDRHPNGILARIHERRMQRWQDDSRPKPQPYVNPQPQPQPQPYVQPQPQPSPPIPNPNAAPDSPPSGTITPANCWVVVMVPSLTSQDSALAAIELNAALRATLPPGHVIFSDPATMQDGTHNGIVLRASTDGLPRAIVIDAGLPADKRIVGSYQVTTAAALTATIKTITGGK